MVGISHVYRDTLPYFLFLEHPRPLCMLQEDQEDVGSNSRTRAIRFDILWETSG